MTNTSNSRVFDVGIGQIYINIYEHSFLRSQVKRKIFEGWVWSDGFEKEPSVRVYHGNDTPAGRPSTIYLTKKIYLRN